MTAAEYFRAWRRQNPAYRAREAERSRLRRLEGRRGSRATEYRNRALREAVAMPPIPAPYTGHPIFDRAREVVGPERSGLTVWLDPLHQDCLSVATLALLEGRDPSTAVNAFRASEHAWRRVTAPILFEVAA